MPAVESPQPATARSSGIDVAYQSAGRGAPALLLVHGIFEDGSYFAPQLAHFSGRRQVVLPDLRGHGRSGPGDTATLEDFVADVVAVIDDARLERVVVGGHSMGGAVALKVAAERPDAVCGVAMLDATVLFPEEVRRAGLEALVPALATEHWLEALRGYFGSRILDPLDPPELTDRVTASLAQARPEIARSFFASVFSSDHAGDLLQARCPLLYIHARVPSDLERLAELRPDAVIGRVVGSGHYLMLTAPDQVNAMLDRFLEMVA